MYTYKNDISGDSITLDINGLKEALNVAVGLAKKESERALSDFQNACFPSDEDSARNMNRASVELKNAADKLQKLTEYYHVIESLTQYQEKQDFRTEVKLTNLPKRVKKLTIK